MRAGNSPSPLPALPRRSLLRKAKNPGGALFKLLRQTALSNRGPLSQTFYSLREVAENFGVSLSLVNRIFLLLEDEGLLGRIRGSRTVLHGRRYDRHLHVRGVVGLPVSTFRFATLPDYRDSIIQMRRQLRRRGFMPAAVFFESREGRGEFLKEHLIEAKADTVIWVSADRKCLEAVALLRDAGVRNIGVRDSGVMSISCRYEIRRENALRVILRHWRAADLKSIVVVSEPRGHSAIDEERWRVSSEDESLAAETMTLDGSRLRRSLTVLIRREKRGIILAGSAAALCALREPEALGELMRIHRVALVDGPISTLFAKLPEVRVDLVRVDWQKVARRIVADLITGAAWSKSESLLYAEAQLDMPLQRFAHEI